MGKTKVAICENCGWSGQQENGHITWGDVVECPSCGKEVNTFLVDPAPSIAEQINELFEKNVDYYERLKDWGKKEGRDMKTLKEQLAYNKKRIPRDYRTDNIQYRISRKARELAKLYSGIENYYMAEDLFSYYILNIIRQAIEEVKNEKNNN